MRVLGIETSCDETAVAIVEAPAGTGPVGTDPGQCRLQPAHRASPLRRRRAGNRRPRPSRAPRRAGDRGAGRGGPGPCRSRRHRRHRRPRPDRRRAGRRHDRPRRWPLLTTSRSSPSTISKATRSPSASPSRSTFPICCCWSSGGHCQLLTVRGPGDFARWARPSTMRPANASTRRRSCSVSAFPAVRRSRRRPSAAIRNASPCRARCGASRAAISPFPASRRRCGKRSRSCRQTIARSRRRSLRLVPAHGGRRARRPLRQRARPRAVTDPGRGGWRGGQCLSARPARRRSRRRTVRDWSRRR